MANLVRNSSFEDGNDHWTLGRTGSAILVLTHGSTADAFTPDGGSRSLRIEGQTLAASAGTMYAMQAISSGFRIGDTLSVRVWRRVPGVLNPIYTYQFIVRAEDVAGAPIADIYSVRTSTIEDAWVAVSGVRSAIPANRQRLAVYFILDKGASSDPNDIGSVYFDSVIIEPLPRDSGSGSGVSGTTHDITLEWDDTLGPVGFNLLHDKDGKLAYFQEQAPVFGDPRQQADSTASDFTLWRSTNQVDFSGGMGQIDFDSDRLEMFQACDRLVITDTGSISRGPLQSTETIPLITHVAASSGYPSAFAVTTYTGTTSIKFICYGLSVLAKVGSGAWSLVYTAASEIIWATGFGRRCYLALGTGGLYRTGIGDTVFAAVGSETAGILGTGEGFIVRIKPDANGAYTQLEKSTTGDSGSFGTTVTFGNANQGATGALNPGFFGGLFYFGTPDGIYSWDGTTGASAVTQAIGFSTASSTSNGRRLVVWRGRLYFTIGSDALYEWDGVNAPRRIVAPWSSEIVSPTNNASAMFTGTIQWLDIAASAWHLYVAIAITASDGTKSSRYYAYDGTGWASVAASGGNDHWQILTFDADENLYLLPKSTNGLSLLSLYKFPISRTLTAAQQDRTVAGTFRSVRLDLQRPLVPKLVSSVVLRYQDLGTKFETRRTAAASVSDGSITLTSVSGIAAGDWLWIASDTEHSDVKYVASVNSSTNAVTFGEPADTGLAAGTTAYLLNAHASGAHVAKVHILAGLHDIATNTTTPVGGAWNLSVGQQLMNLPVVSPFVSQRFEVRLYWPGSASSTAGTADEWAIKYIFLPAVARRWRWSLNLRQGATTVGRFTEPRSTSRMISQVWDAVGARRLVRYRDIDGQEYTVRLGQPEIRVEERESTADGAKLRTAVCTWSAIELGADLISST